MAARLPILACLSLALVTSACAGDDDAGDETTSETTEASGDGGELGGDGDGDDGGDGDAGGDGDGDGDGDVSCIEVTTAEWIGLGEGVEVIIGPLTPQLGDTGVNDTLQIELYNDLPPLDTPIDLGAVPNDNYASCDQCVRVLEDQIGQSASKQYFQSAGTITFHQLSGVAQWRGLLEDVTLVEVEVDAGFNSTPVEGGACLTISGALDFDTLPGG